MKSVKIHGDDWDLGYVLAMLKNVKRDKLIKAKWEPRDALVRLDGSRATIYTGQDFDPAQYQIKRKFWDHDHCQVCNWTLFASDDPGHVNGYTDGYNWLCTECNQKFVEGKEFNRSKDQHQPDDEASGLSDERQG
jgi:hypothetical protein